jgi:hypothetical protein
LVAARKQARKGGRKEADERTDMADARADTGPPRIALAWRSRTVHSTGNGTSNGNDNGRDNGASEATRTAVSSDDGAPSEAGSFRHSLSRGRRHGERVSFLAATPIEEFVAKYQVVKVSWRGKYERILALAPTRFCTIDPTDFEVTNTWSLTALSGINLESGDQQVGTAFSCCAAIGLVTVCVCVCG